MMKTGKIVFGVLAAAAVGAALGILFAPDKGTATRKKISKKGREYAEDLGGKFDDFIQSITTKFESMKDEARLAGNGTTKEGEPKVPVVPTSKA